MAKFHIVERAGPNLYRVVVHSNTPAGTNSAANISGAGIAWATAIKNSSNPVTVLEIGAGPGRISSTEATAITNGTIIETEYLWQDDPALTPQQRLADITARADAAIAEAIGEMQTRLKYFGVEIA